nr:MAG TPA: hypothetical protein [Caudoviricetes sp.]
MLGRICVAPALGAILCNPSPGVSKFLGEGVRPGATCRAQNFPHAGGGDHEQE